MRTAQRCELLLFVAAFLGFAYFNQGGGWNQNARFAEIRAIVEEGRFAIDHFLVYQRDPASDELVRCPLKNAEYEWEGKRNRLCWVDMDWNLLPVGDHPLNGAAKAAMVERCTSGDIGYVPQSGEFHPNKPPGTSFLAVPGYFVIYHVERLLGIDPDHWWVLDVNLWLTSVFSVGVVAALGCVVFFRLAGDLAAGAILPALGATVAFAFGTTFFPFATLLFDHALTASLLVFAFYLLRVARRPGDCEGFGRWAGILAGLSGGCAVLTNYLAVGAVAILGFYALAPRAQAGESLWRRLDRHSTLGFIVGGILPALVLLWYGYVCFGSPFRPSTDFQNPLFKEPGLFLGMFSLPTNWDDFWRILYVVQVLIYSPFRGVFWFSPVLIFGVAGLLVWWRARVLRPEALVCAGIFLFFFAVNACFNGFHAGFSAGPRYLVPGLPFLALPLVTLFASPGDWRQLAGALTALSVAINLLLTATDAQNPAGVGGHARVEGHHAEWTYDPIGEYALPLFAQGRAWPLLRQQIEVQLDKTDAELDAQEEDPASRVQRREAMHAELVASIRRGEPSPFLLGSITGPVSVNPIGAFEGLLTYGFYEPGSLQTRWASFNLGEFFFPQSRWSLLPLLLLAAALLGAAWREARRSPE